MASDLIVVPADIPSAVTWDEASALAGLAKGCTVLELGAHYGFSTIVLASVAERVWSVDWHGGDVHAGLGDSWEVFQANLARYDTGGRVVVCRGRFEDEVPRLAAEGVVTDGAFIDGQHDEESVRRDLALVLTVVRPGGWVAFHDYGRGPHTGHPGFAITAVADEFGVDGVTGCLAWGERFPVHNSVIAFAASALTAGDVNDQDVIEAGSYNVNGSVRDMITGLGAKSYTGIDLQDGPGVDVVMDAADLPGDLGQAGLVVSTSCLEHTADWKTALRGMISAVKPGGIFLLTCPSAGFPYHEYPGDNWRFSVASMEGIITAAGLDILTLVPDPQQPGICLKARKPDPWTWPPAAGKAWDEAEVTPP